MGDLKLECHEHTKSCQSTNSNQCMQYTSFNLDTPKKIKNKNKRPLNPVFL